MKKIVSLILVGLILAAGADAIAQNSKGKGKGKGKNSKGQTSVYVEGRQKVRESDYATFNKFTNFSTKNDTVYYSTFNYIDLPALTVDPNPEWPDEIRPVMNYLDKVSRASMTLCLLYAINPEITDHAEREELHKKAREEAKASLDAFTTWKGKKGMRNKTQYKVAEIDYRYFKGANFYNEQRGDNIIHVGVLIYLGSKKKSIFSTDTTTHTFPDIRFFPNDATLMESWFPVLDELADYLKNNDRKGVLLSGYADNQGTEAYCTGVSRQRAMEVKKALLMRGIDATRIEIVAKGDEDPIGDNSTYEGRIQNNRVSIKIQ
ncbi:MAG: OmpA family protein [Bacteroidales bacterium]|nr:OmpA family protein [Bacteroidales bacterium]